MTAGGPPSTPHLIPESLLLACRLGEHTLHRGARRKGAGMRGFKIARVFGIDIAIHPSWFIILAVLVWSLADNVFPSAYAWSRHDLLDRRGDRGAAAVRLRPGPRAGSLAHRQTAGRPREGHHPLHSGRRVQPGGGAPLARQGSPHGRRRPAVQPGHRRRRPCRRARAAGLPRPCAPSCSISAASTSSWVSSTCSRASRSTAAACCGRRSGSAAATWCAPRGAPPAPVRCSATSSSPSAWSWRSSGRCSAASGWASSAGCWCRPRGPPTSRSGVQARLAGVRVRDLTTPALALVPPDASLAHRGARLLPALARTMPAGRRRRGAARRRAVRRRSAARGPRTLGAGAGGRGDDAARARRDAGPRGHRRRSTAPPGSRPGQSGGRRRGRPPARLRRAEATAGLRGRRHRPT